MVADGCAPVIASTPSVASVDAAKQRLATIDPRFVVDERVTGLAPRATRASIEARAKVRATVRGRRSRPAERVLDRSSVHHPDLNAFGPGDGAL
jgi:hypothetical protein